MNKVVYVLLGLSLAANGYFLLNHNAQEGKVVIKETTVEKQESKQAKEDKIIQSTPSKPDETSINEQFYLDKIAELEARIAMLQEQENGDNRSKQKKAFFTQTSETLDREIMEKLELDMNKPKESFKTETVDPTWAFERQDAIYELFNNSDITNQINLKDVTCKTTVCRISMETFDTKQSSKMMAMMDASQLIRTNDLLTELSNQSTVEPDTNRIFMYLYQEDEESE